MTRVKYTDNFRLFSHRGDMGGYTGRVHKKGYWLSNLLFILEIAELQFVEICLYGRSLDCLDEIQTKVFLIFFLM